MNRWTNTLGISLLLCLALVSAPAFADDDDAKMMAQLALIKKSCEEHQAEAKRKEQELEAAKASANLPPQQAQDVERKLQKLKSVIAETDELLARPMPQTRADQESYLKTASGAIAATHAYESAVSKDLRIDPASRVEAVLQKLGSAEDFQTRFGAFDNQNAVSNAALGAAAPPGANTSFFGLAGRLPPSAIVQPQLSSAYTPTTVEAATKISNQDHGVGGGIMLEGAAGGLAPVSSATYDGSINALVLNGDLVYFVKIPPWSLATMCREIGADRNALLGVSETGIDGLTFGDKPEIYKGTDLAYELMMADKFLGDVIFGQNHSWTQGYRFPGSAPVPAAIKSSMLVRFSFGNFQFGADDGQLSLVSSSLEVRMMPTSAAQSPTGQLLPDYNAMDKGWTPPGAFVANARILTDNVAYFRNEALINAVFADGETAAVLRSLKQANVNLDALATTIESGNPG